MPARWWPMAPVPARAATARSGSCTANRGNCNNVVSDGCETDLLKDAQHCGTCSTVCSAPPHATPGCAAGKCGIGACNTGYADCNGLLGDGCEFDTMSDPSNCGGCGVVCGSGQCANAKCVCLTTVLLIADDSSSGAATLKSALEGQGLTVTQTSVPSYQYDGTNPAPTGFGAIVLLAGGPGSTSYSTDMPSGGQTAIVNYVAQSNGLVLTEWAAKHVADMRWQTLAPLVLLSRTVAYSGQVTYTIDPGFTGHPIWEGLTDSFTFASTSNVGLTKVGSGIKRIAGSTQAIDAVAVRDLASQGRIVHIAHAGNYAPQGWTNPNIQRLVANAAKWAARCN